MKFVWIPTGCFDMGSTRDKSEQPVHKVCLNGFWMGRYEVTQGEYQQVTGNNPSKFQASHNPVEQVSWIIAADFSLAMGSITGTEVRLPSEAQWEYACRAGGAHEKFCGRGSHPDQIAWYGRNSGDQTHPVGQREANNWGLNDMSGNVWEWTRDCWKGNYNGTPTNGSAWEGQRDPPCNSYILRGGSWSTKLTGLRASYRKNSAFTGQDDVGYLVVRVSP
jgi:formylglycine-generating enzyme required for sulfatase activity